MNDDVVRVLTDDTDDAMLFPLAYLLEKHGPITVSSLEMDPYEGRVLRFTPAGEDAFTISVDKTH